MVVIEVLLSLIAFSANSYLGLLVFLRNRLSWTNRLFFLLALLINVYIVVNFISLHPPLPTPESQLFWIRMVMAEVAFLGPTLFILVHTFPRAQISLSKKIIVPLIALSFFTSFIAFATPLVFKGIEYPNGNPVPIPGSGIPIFFFDFVGLFVVSFILLIYKYRKSKGIEKQQHLYFLIGTLFTFSLMAIFTVIFVVILKQSGFVFLGPLMIAFLIASIAYAITKHQFLDIQFLVVRSVAYLLTIFILGFAYALGVFGFELLVLNKDSNLYELLSSTFFAMLVMFTFQPLRRFLSVQTENFFYQREYDPPELLKKVSKVSTSILLLQNLIQGFLKIMKEDMKISDIGIAIAGERKIYFFGGIDPNDLHELEDGHLSSEKIYQKFKNALLTNSEQILVFDQLEETSVKSLMRKLHLAVVLPLVVNNKFLGCLLIKEKLSGAGFTSEDLRILQLIAPQLAISMRNALSFEEIRHFNSTLEEKVSRATHKLKNANEKLKELDKLKDEFVSVASHELRTPMTAIKSYLWMALQGKGGDLTVKQKYYLSRAYSSTDRLIRLVNQMLNISRIESGRIALNIQKIDIMKLLIEVISEVAPRAQELELHLELNPEVIDADGKKLKRVEVLADIDKIKEVVINFIGNSLKFTPKDGKILLVVHKDKEMVTIQIQDTGVGIAAEFIPSLFQKFGLIKGSYQTNQDASQGTGLGLYISKSIVELHDGKIWAESAGKGKGATFSFTLPVFSDKKMKEFSRKFNEASDAGIIRNTV